MFDHLPYIAEAETPVRNWTRDNVHCVLRCVAFVIIGTGFCEWYLHGPGPNFPLLLIARSLGGAFVPLFIGYFFSIFAKTGYRHKVWIVVSVITFALAWLGRFTYPI